MPTTNKIVCPHCGQSYNVKAELWAQYQGRLTSCKKCQQKFRVGAPAEAPVAAMVEPAEWEAAAPPPPAVPPLPTFAAMPPGAPPGPNLGNGMAIASLVLGLLGCVPGSGLVGLILGIVGLRRTKDPRVGGKGMAIAGIVLGSVGIVGWAVFAIQLARVGSVLLPVLSRANETANRVKSASNLKRIGRGVLLYANDNMGNFPPNIEQLLATQELTVNTFVSPSSATVIPDAIKNGTKLQQAKWANEHSDYIYLGAGRNQTMSFDEVLAYEKLGIHGTMGTNILFADGRVEWLAYDPAKTLIDKQASAGRTRPGGH